MTFLIALLFQILFVTPPGNKKLAEKEGDLDKDGIAEKVVVYNTTDSTEFGTVREIQILKNQKGSWVLWKSSKSAIRKSEEGGMMGDPFGGIKIDHGILFVYHDGGSSWKWNYTDRYRYQNNEFELIGHTSNFGKPCEYWVNFDFNLSIGKIIYKKEFERCDNDQTIYKTEQDTFYKKEIQLNLTNRYLKEIRILVPKYKEELYL